MRGHGYSTLLVLTAFAGSLFIGKLAFDSNSKRDDMAGLDRQANSPSITNLAQAETKPISAREEFIKKLSERHPTHTIKQELVATKDGDGVENTNFKMHTFIAKEHAQGVVYSHRLFKNNSAKYTPLGMGYANGFDKVSSFDMNLKAKGEIKKLGEAEVFEFKETFPNIDERMKTRPDGGTEHDYIIKEKPQDLDIGKELTAWQRLELTPGMTVWQGGKQLSKRHVTNEAFQIRDQYGMMVFEVRRPYAYDNNVTASDGGLDDDSQLAFPGSLVGCKYYLEISDNHLDVAVATPTRWLKDPKRAYPVTVDPNIGPGGLTDATFNNGQPIYNGTTGSGTFLGIHNGAINPGADPNGPPTQQPSLLSIPCPLPNGQAIRLNAFGNGCYVIPLPFDFVYYNILRAQCCPLGISINGVASFLPPCGGGIDPASPVAPCARPNNTFVPSPSAPNDSIFAYWDALNFSADPLSGVYVMLQGPVGQRRLIIEWFSMAFVNGNGNEKISFNLILSECNNLIEIIVGSQGTPDVLDPNVPNPSGGTNRPTGDTDRGEATVGIEDPSGTIGIQFDFNSSVAGTPTAAGEFTPLEPITPETSIVFSPVATSLINVTVDGNSVVNGQAFNPGQCLPVRSCFNALVIPPDTGCGVNTASFPPSFGFEWTLTLPDTVSGGNTIIGLFKTAKFCKTFVTPGAINVTLSVQDATGTKSVFGNFTYLVCDFPRIELAAAPQGGTLPLEVQFGTISSASFSDTIAAQPPDDCNVMPVGRAGLTPGDVVVLAGDDGVLHTKPEGDDVLDILNQQILAGPNGINETTALNGSGVVVAGGVDTDGDGLADDILTTPVGNDCYSGINIVAGPDGLSETPVIGTDDRQIVAPGLVAGAPGTPIWKIEKLSERDLQTPPAFISNMPSGVLNPTFIFTQEGIYKVTVIWTGIDAATNLPTSAEYSIFIFTESSSRPNDDNLYIDGSDFQIKWKGKTDRPDDNDLDPDNPNQDSMVIRGMLNLPNLFPSALGSMPIRARVVLNGTLPLFDFGDGVLNPNGKTVVRDAFTGTQRTFSLNLPSGRFSVYARKIRLDQVLGAINLTENRVLPMHIRLELYDFTDPNNPVAIYPQEPETRGAMITYDYRSIINGTARGRYRFGNFTADGQFVVGKPGLPGGTTSPPVPPEINVIKTGGQTILVSGVFLVQQANLKLAGSNVTCDIRGKMARYGGDDLRPQANTDVVVGIGPARDSLGNTIASGFEETLNFSTSPTWQTVGKKRRELFVFKRDKSLGQTGIKQMYWHNHAGEFRIRTYAIPNRDEGALGGVGLDVTDLTQVVPFRLFISHDNDTNTSLQNFDGRTEFLVTKSGKSGFRRK